MLVVHHLNDSRSQRVLWLLEELGLPYEIRHYQRDATTRLAPPELKAVHPLGKSPVLERWRAHGDRIRRHRRLPDPAPRQAGCSRRPARRISRSTSNGCTMPRARPCCRFLLKLYVSRLGDAGAPLSPRIESEIANHLGYVEPSLQGRHWLVGDALSGADIMMSFVGEVAGARAERGVPERPGLGAALPAAAGLPQGAGARRALLLRRLKHQPTRRRKRSSAAAATPHHVGGLGVGGLPAAKAPPGPREPLPRCAAETPWTGGRRTACTAVAGQPYGHSRARSGLAAAPSLRRAATHPFAGGCGKYPVPGQFAGPEAPLGW